MATALSLRGMDISIIFFGRGYRYGNGCGHSHLRGNGLSFGDLDGAGYGNGFGDYPINLILK